MASVVLHIGARDKSDARPMKEGAYQVRFTGRELRIYRSWYLVGYQIRPRQAAVDGRP